MAAARGSIDHGFFIKAKGETVVIPKKPLTSSVMSRPNALRSGSRGLLGSSAGELGIGAHHEQKAGAPPPPIQAAAVAARIPVVLAHMLGRTLDSLGCPRSLSCREHPRLRSTLIAHR